MREKINGLLRGKRAPAEPTDSKHMVPFFKDAATNKLQISLISKQPQACAVGSFERVPAISDDRV
jgi:hypothetical protein